MTYLRPNRSTRILLVEDNIGDARLTREALVDCAVACEIVHVRDGIEAMSFLRQEPPYEEAQLPDLILLDLNMPRMDGREFLAQMRQDARLTRIPVIVLTTSESRNDIESSYDLGANAYLIKPVDFSSFEQTVRVLEAFWLTTATLPDPEQ